jgi:hypothetical protein
VKRLAADRSHWKSFVAALCSSTGDDRKWWCSFLRTVFLICLHFIIDLFYILGSSLQDPLKLNKWMNEWMNKNTSQYT